MPDDVDISTARQEIEERILRSALPNPDAQEVARNEEGTCLNCGREVEAPRRWCNKDCLIDWEKYIKPQQGN